MSNDWSAYFTVVATGAGMTTVEVTTTGALRAGPGVPPLPASVSHTFQLMQFQTLNLESLGPADITGSVVRADRPVAMFAGHQAAQIPNPFPFTNPCCADHLEEQVLPNSTWGKRYAVAYTRDPASSVYRDYVRVLAMNPGTVVAVATSTTPISSTCDHILQPGQFCDFFMLADVEVTATEPVLVGHFLVSGGGIGPTSGDPSLAFAVPTEQFRTSYTFLVPQYYAANYISVVSPPMGQVKLDGAVISGLLKPFGSGAFASTRLSIMAGRHELDCPAGCGVEVYGFGTAISYLFAGGMKLEKIVVQ
jgi:hypothetical protein